MVDCLVLIPTYNEAENVVAICRAVLARGERFGVLIIDDDSPDGTGAIADELAQKEPRVAVLHRPVKEGLGPAYLAGFAAALTRPEVEFVLTMDADFSHDPADLTRLLAACENGADLAVGSRYTPGGGVRDWSLVRRLVSRGGGSFARLMLGLKIHDPTAGFTALRRRVLESIGLQNIRGSGYGYQIEMKHRIQRLGFAMVEVPIIFTDRRQGASKMTVGIALEALALVLRLALGSGRAGDLRAGD